VDLCEEWAEAALFKATIYFFLTGKIFEVNKKIM
jgi:hypothetical protein